MALCMRMATAVAMYHSGFGVGDFVCAFQGFTDRQRCKGKRSMEVEKLLFDRKSVAFAVSISVYARDHLIAGKQVNTRGGKKVLIPKGERKRFAQAYNMEGAA